MYVEIKERVKKLERGELIELSARLIHLLANNLMCSGTEYDYGWRDSRLSIIESLHLQKFIP